MNKDHFPKNIQMDKDKKKKKKDQYHKLSENANTSHNDISPYIFKQL